MRLISALASTLLGVLALEAALKDEPEKRAQQNVVTWDAHSLLINGQRTMLYSGEFHPFRLPVPSLWSDVFQKIKALGLNTVSFYVHWALLEGKPGSFSAKGVFDLGAFMEAGKQAGLYLIARPGPYISTYILEPVGTFSCSRHRLMTHSPQMRR